MLNVKKGKLAVFLLSLTYTTSLHAQGINFEKKLSWQQVKDKAQKETKYIFVDCSATWCGPCKKMEKEVFAAEKVGDFFNKNFISVKLQMDSTAKDNDQVKSWHATASAFKKQYKITAYPTYLYFSPNGKILNKNIGFYDVEKFISMSKNSLNPDNQYYTLLENYQQGKKNYNILPQLATAAKRFNDTAIAGIMARDYLNYLSLLDENLLYTKDNITFIKTFLYEHKSYFNLFYNNRSKIDSIMNQKGYAQSIVDNFISSEAIFPFLKEADKTNKKPDWQKIQYEVSKKYYPEDADRNLLLNKLRWSDYKNDWGDYAHAALEMFERHKENIDAFNLNNFAWNTFMNITDSSLLKAALSWSSRSLELSSPDLLPNHMDTKANIVYKLGHTSEALILEKKALLLAEKQNQEGVVKQCKENIVKMETGIPTWNTKQ